MRLSYFRLGTAAVTAALTLPLSATAAVAAPTTEITVEWPACDTVEVRSDKDISNVVLRFLDGDTQRFEAGDWGRSGSFSGTGADARETIDVAWVKSGNNVSGDGPGYGERFDNDLGCEAAAGDETSGDQGSTDGEQSVGEQSGGEQPGGDQGSTGGDGPSGDDSADGGEAGDQDGGQGSDDEQTDESGGDGAAAGDQSEDESGGDDAAATGGATGQDGAEDADPGSDSDADGHQDADPGSDSDADGHQDADPGSDSDADAEQDADAGQDADDGSADTDQASEDAPSVASQADQEIAPDQDATPGLTDQGSADGATDDDQTNASGDVEVAGDAAVLGVVLDAGAPEGPNTATPSAGGFTQGDENNTDSTQVLGDSAENPSVEMPVAAAGDEPVEVSGDTLPRTGASATSLLLAALSSLSAGVTALRRRPQ